MIDIYLAPIVNFSFTGDPTVAFTDLSTNAPTSWSWDFGDGRSRPLQDLQDLQDSTQMAATTFASLPFRH